MPLGVALSAALTLPALPASAQPQPADEIASWTTVGAQGELPPQRLSLYVWGQLRLTDRLSQLGSVLTEAGLGVKLCEHATFTPGYRLFYARGDDDRLRLGHRAFSDLAGSLKGLSGWGASYRLRAQRDWEDRSNQGLAASTTLRYAPGLSYRFTERARAAFSFEHFLNPAAFGSGATRRVRFTLGPKFAMERLDLELFYRFEMRPDRPRWSRTHILGVAIEMPWGA